MKVFVETTKREHDKIMKWLKSSGAIVLQEDGERAVIFGTMNRDIALTYLSCLKATFQKGYVQGWVFCNRRPRGFAWR